MQPIRFQRILAPLLLSLLLLVTACGETKPPGPFDQAQQQSTQSKTKLQPNTQQAATKPQDGSLKAPTGKTVAGGSLNKYFPASDAGFDRVYTQEKTGFAEAKLKKGGKEVAMLSINDITNNPSAINKFQTSSKKIGGFPSAVQGKGTAVLVGGRYQVKVQSKDDSFTEGDRETWLQKFNLSGLASLK